METTERRKKKPPKVDEMTREQLQKALLKKRECSAKAQKIVESLLEADVSEKYLLNSLRHISQCHLEDVVEERAIIKLCGYPLCNKKLPENIPKQQYRISFKTNKVYDITSRKNFCSNGCYKAAMFIKKQMSTGPLWFREHEYIPNFMLLSQDSVGSLGEEIDLSIIEKVKVNHNNYFTSVVDFAKVSLNEFPTEDGKLEINSQNDDYNVNLPKNNDESEHKLSNTTNDSKIIVQNNINNNESKVTNEMEIEEKDTKPKENTQTNIKSNSTPNPLNNINNNESKVTNEMEIEEKDTKPKENTQTNIKSNSTPNPFNIVGEIKERKSQNKVYPILTPAETKINIRKPKHGSKIRKPLPPVTQIVIHVETCISEWFTLDSMIFLFGEQRVKEMVADKGDCIKEYLNNMANGLFYSSTSYDQYQQLCRKLNMLELEDRRYDSQLINKEMKPLPDYSLLKEASKRMELKVKAFLTGSTDITEPHPGSNNETNNTDSSKNEPEDTSGLTHLPLVDKNSQNALRRKIILQHLNKVLPDLLQSLGLDCFSLSGEIRLLVHTFKLKANNIMFKPQQWAFIAIVILKLLSLRNAELYAALNSNLTNEHLQLLLLSYRQDGGYLDRLLSWLTDIDRLLHTNATQLTIG